MNVITFARSPVIPKATKTSAGRGSSSGPGVVAGAMVVIAFSSLASCLAGDSRPSFVRQPCPSPDDDGLRTILVRRQQRQMYRSPGQRGRLALHRSPAEHLHDGRDPSDRRHRPFVPVLERLRRLAGDLAGDCLAGVLARLARPRAELWQPLIRLRVGDRGDVTDRVDLRVRRNSKLFVDADPVAPDELKPE